MYRVVISCNVLAFYTQVFPDSENTAIQNIDRHWNIIPSNTSLYKNSQVCIKIAKNYSRSYLIESKHVLKTEFWLAAWLTTALPKNCTPQRAQTNTTINKYASEFTENHTYVHPSVKDYTLYTLKQSTNIYMHIECQFISRRTGSASKN